MPQKELENLLKMFEDGSGFGDPDARRNAEQKLQYLPATTSSRLSTILAHGIAFPKRAAKRKGRYRCFP